MCSYLTHVGQLLSLRVVHRETDHGRDPEHKSSILPPLTSPIPICPMLKILFSLTTDARDPRHKAEIIRMAVILVLLLIQCLAMFSQCDLGGVKNKPRIAKKSVVTNPIPWSSTRPRLSRSMVVGGDSRGAIRRRVHPEKNVPFYSVPQVQKGRLVTCGFVGFFQGRIDKLGGGIKHQNALTMGVACVGISTVLPYRQKKTHRSGILGPKLVNAFCYLVAYNVGLGLARTLTPAYGDL